MTLSVTISDIEAFADNLNAEQATNIYKEHSCLVVRGLMVRGFRRALTQTE